MPEPAPPLVKYAFTYLFVQAEFGLMCPISMSDTSNLTIRKYGSDALKRLLLDRLLSTDMTAVLKGAQFMTEKAGGSDVGAIETEAEPIGMGPDGIERWRIFGDKWFCSHADADVTVMLARPRGAAAGTKGLGLFALPRRLEDGSRNAYRVVRLKDKLGTRSMASGEVRLEAAEAYLVGERGRGFQQLADMVNSSRLSNAVRAAGLMRRAATEALFVARRRRAFGKTLIEMPLMRRQLGKMLLATEQARTMMFLTAQALHRANQGDATAAKLTRIMTPLIKFRACRDARKVTGDAMEVRGGCGYIEEWPDARLLRDAHLGSIWEGTSNIVALDVLRAIARDDCLPVLEAYASGLLNDAALDGENHALFAATLARACALAGDVAANRSEAHARQAASALYHVTSAIGLALEATQAKLPHRLALARQVLSHRLLPRDPLACGSDEPVLPGSELA
jgi:alkylation response protein AidB-like acyl-CoA dehydrogenase